MSRPISRFTLANLLLMGAVVAAGCAGMSVAADWMVPTASLLTLVMLFVGLLGVILHGRRSGGWVGFALFGWGFVVLSILPDRLTSGSPISQDQIEAFIDHAIDQLHPVPAEPQIPAFAAGQSIDTLADGRHRILTFYPVRTLTPSEETLYQNYVKLEKVWKVQMRDPALRSLNARPISRAFLALAFGLVGMVAGKALLSRLAPDRDRALSDTVL